MSEYTKKQLTDACEEYSSYVLKLKGSWQVPNFDEWWEERNSPPKKVIDLSHFIRSGIDCEFAEGGERWHWVVARSLKEIQHMETYSDGRTTWDKCRPRTKYKMFHNGANCPIPAGLRINIFWRTSCRITRDKFNTQLEGVCPTTLRWNHMGMDSDIMGFEILGPAVGWVYGWENR